MTRSEWPGASGKGQGQRGQRARAKGAKGQVTTGKSRGASHEGQGARGKGQGAKGKEHGVLKEKWEWQWKRGLERKIVNETGCEKKIGKGMEEREWRKRIGDERG